LGGDLLNKLLNKTLSSQLTLNMFSGSISVVFGFLVAMIKYPLFIHYLGYETYGTWLILSTILIFAQMGLIGINPAITKLTAEEFIKEEKGGIQEYFFSSMLFLGFICFLLLIFSIFFRWDIVTSLGLNGDNAIVAASLLSYMVVFSMSVLAYQIINSILSGLGRVDIANYSQTIIQIISLILSIPLLMMDYGIYGLLISNTLAYLVIFIYNFRKINQLINISFLKIKSFSLFRLKKMLSFGGYVFAGSTLSMLLVPITKIFISRLIGVEGVTIFELAYRVGMQVRSFFQIAFKALVPEMSKLFIINDKKRIRTIISKSFFVLFLFATPLYLFSYIFSEDIFKLWLRNDYNELIPRTFNIMLLMSFISLIGVIIYYVYIGLGEVRKVFYHHLISALGTISMLVVSNFFQPDILSISLSFVFGSLLGSTYLVISWWKNSKKIFSI